MLTRRELLMLAANTENVIRATQNPAKHQLEMRDRIFEAAYKAGITEDEIRAAAEAARTPVK